MVEHVIKDKKHKVIIRCDELANARGESELLTNLAKQIGYTPLFQFMNTINNMVDVAITATTGQKAGELYNCGIFCSNFSRSKSMNLH